VEERKEEYNKVWLFGIQLFVLFLGVFESTGNNIGTFCVLGAKISISPISLIQPCAGTWLIGYSYPSR
jgi:hypothetical protein